jgi:sialic acid synthase SpsE
MKSLVKYAPYVMTLMLSLSACGGGDQGESEQPFLAKTEGESPASVASFSDLMKDAKANGASLRRAYKKGDIIQSDDVQPAPSPNNSTDVVPGVALPGVKLVTDIQAGETVLKKHVAQNRKAVFAGRNIKRGSALEAADVEERDLENAILPESAFQSVAKVVGRYAKAEISQGAVIMESDLESAAGQALKVTETGK